MSRIVSRFISHQIPFIVLCLGDSVQKDWFLAFMSRDCDRVRTNVKTSFHFSRYKSTLCEVELPSEEVEYIRDQYNAGQLRAVSTPFGLVYEVNGCDFRKLSSQPHKNPSPQKNPTNNTPHLLSLGQAAYRLNVPRRIIRGYAKRGELPFILSEDGEKMFKLEDLNRLPQNHELLP